MWIIQWPKTLLDYQTSFRMSSVSRFSWKYFRQVFYSFGYCSARYDTYLVQIQCKYCHIMRGLYWYLAIKIFEFLYQITYIVSVFTTIHYVFIKETGSLYFRFPVLKGLKIMTTISGFQRFFFSITTRCKIRRLVKKHTFLMNISRV